MTAPASRGFTLVEAMVALLVLSIGMLGLAAMHGQALAASGMAIHRSQAVSFAGHMADRIRLNRQALAAYAGPAGNRDCDDSIAAEASDCSPTELAANDLFIWQAELARGLPGGTGSVAVDSATNPARYRITVAWDEPATAEPAQFALEFRLPTF